MLHLYIYLLAGYVVWERQTISRWKHQSVCDELLAGLDPLEVADHVVHDVVGSDELLQEAQIAGAPHFHQSAARDGLILFYGHVVPSLRVWM